jgi:hypothetical protein
MAAATPAELADIHREMARRNRRDVWAEGIAVSLPPMTRKQAEAAGRMAAALDERIRKIVDAAPPLTAEQRDKLALLLRPSEMSRP